MKREARQRLERNRQSRAEHAHHMQVLLSNELVENAAKPSVPAKPEPKPTDKPAGDGRR